MKLGITLLALLTAGPLSAATIRVPADSPTLAAGLAAAAGGDTVLVACGTYHEHDLSMPSGVVLRGETGDPACVVIDAQQQGRVLSCHSCDAGTHVEGVTLRGGYQADTGPTAGGLWIEFGAPRFLRCRVTANEVCGSNGASAMGVAILEAAPVFEDCSIDANEMQDEYVTAGMNCTFATVTLFGCSFVGNHSWLGRIGALACRENSSVTAVDCEFIDNHGTEHGAVYCDHSELSLTGCILDDNSSTYDGAGIFAADSELLIDRCLVAGGHDADQGGGLRLIDSVVAIEGSTIASNETDAGGGPTPGGGILARGSTIELLRTVLWGNCCWAGYGDDAHAYSGSLSFECCVVDPSKVSGPATYVGTNYDQDPLFCGPADCGLGGGDYTVDAASVCLPASNDCGALIGVFGQGCGTTGARESSWGAVKAMY